MLKKYTANGRDWRRDDTGHKRLLMKTKAAAMAKDSAGCYLVAYALASLGGLPIFAAS